MTAKDHANPIGCPYCDGKSYGMGPEAREQYKKYHDNGHSWVISQDHAGGVPPTQIGEAEQGGLAKPEDTAKPSHNQADKLGAKLLAAIDASGNEFAMGYDDSGCFWRFYYGNRGAGSMMEGWPQFNSESPEVGEALDEYLRHAGVTDLATTSPNTNTDLSNPQEQRIAEYKQLLKELPEKKPDLRGENSQHYCFNDCLDQCRAIIEARIKELE